MTEYETVAPTQLSDRECSLLRVCSSDEYISVAATATTDRVCAACVACDPATQVRVAGTCKDDVPGECEFIDLCTASTCSNGGMCSSFNGTTLVCNCTGTGFCGTTCEAPVVDGACSLEESSAVASTTLIGAGVGSGLLVLVVVVVVVYLLFKETKRARNVYVPSKEFRERTKPDEWELDRELLAIGSVLGEGAFGLVSRGLLRRSQDASDTMAPAIDVAVKQLKGNANGTAEEEEFFKEMDLMKALGRHKHVLSLVGVCTLDDPILLVTEFAELGDLRNFVQSKRATARHGPLLNNTHFVDFGAQIASGMAFLEDHKVCAAGFLALVVWRLQKERRYLMPAT